MKINLTLLIIFISIKIYGQDNGAPPASEEPPFYITFCNKVKSILGLDEDKASESLLSKAEEIYSTITSAKEQIDFLSDIIILVDDPYRQSEKFYLSDQLRIIFPETQLDWESVIYVFNNDQITGTDRSIRKSVRFAKRLQKIIQFPEDYLRRKVPILKWKGIIDETLEKTHPTIKWSEGLYVFYENLLLSQGIEAELDPISALYTVARGFNAADGFSERMNTILEEVDVFKTRLEETRQKIRNMPEIADHDFYRPITEDELISNIAIAPISAIASEEAKIAFAKKLRVLNYLLYLNEYEACLQQRIDMINHIFLINREFKNSTKLLYDQVLSEAKSELVSSKNPFGLPGYLSTVESKDKKMINSYLELKDPWQGLNKVINVEDQNFLKGLLAQVRVKRNEIQNIMTTNGITLP
jgi:hypothetical protein